MEILYNGGRPDKKPDGITFTKCDTLHGNERSGWIGALAEVATQNGGTR